MKAKISTERTEKNQKEKELIAYKHQYKQHSASGSVIGGAFRMGGTRGQGFSSRLRAKKREKAFNHVFEKDEPLRTVSITLTEAEKETLKRKIAEQKQR